jgi:hypothetical protein
MTTNRGQKKKRAAPRTPSGHPPVTDEAQHDFQPKHVDIQSTGVARVIADKVVDLGEGGRTLVMLLKLEHWCVAEVQMFGYLEEPYLDEDGNCTDRLMRFAFILAPKGRDYRLEFFVNPEDDEEDQDEESISEILGMKLEVGTRFAYITLLSDARKPQKDPFQVRSIHFI